MHPDDSDVPEEGARAERVYRACARTVRAIAPLVPRWRRAEWTKEWQGELWHRVEESSAGRPLDLRTAADLVRRTSGALPHALWLRHDEWRIDLVLQDLKYALRSTLARPAFAALVVLTLALGIGANTAMFSLVNAILIRPLPYPEAKDLVYLYGAYKGGSQAAISPADFLDYRERNAVFASLAAQTEFGSTILAGTDEPEQLPSSVITANYFTTLGVAPMLGRAFLPEEEIGDHAVVILSNRLWQRRFAGDTRVIGTTAILGGTVHTIVGVMPPVLDLTLREQLWTPVPFRTEETSVRRFHFLRGVARLAPNVTLAQAQRQMDGIARQLERMYPENESWRLRLVPYRDAVVGTVGTALLVLVGAVGLVLLIACGNVTSLLLAEIGIRMTLGAPRGGVFALVIRQGMALVVAGIVIGILASVGMTRLLAKLLFGVGTTDVTVFVAVTAMLIVAGLVACIVPARRATRVDPLVALRD